MLNQYQERTGQKQTHTATPKKVFGVKLYYSDVENTAVKGSFTVRLKVTSTNISAFNSFENIVGKGENAGNQHFLLFPQCFLPIPERTSMFKL